MISGCDQLNHKLVDISKYREEMIAGKKYNHEQSSDVVTGITYTLQTPNS